MELDWDEIGSVAKSTGQPIRIGFRSDFSPTEMRNNAVEATKRNLCLSMGNPQRDPSERKGEIYAQAKL